MISIFFFWTLALFFVQVIMTVISFFFTIFFLTIFFSIFFVWVCAFGVGSCNEIPKLGIAGQFSKDIMGLFHKTDNTNSVI